MKFSTNEDISIPMADAFAMLTDFDAFERLALRRGATVARRDRLREKGVGMSWDASFRMRGKQREMTAEMVSFTPSDGYSVEVHSGNLMGDVVVELVPLSKSRTRMSFSVEIKPKSLSGRLMVQTMKIGKKRLTRSFKFRTAEFAKSLEQRYTSGGRA